MRSPSKVARRDTVHPTSQETFWAGHFGDRYIHRNTGKTFVDRDLALFTEITKFMPGVRSLIEFGANTGVSLAAIKQLLPYCELSAVEINAKAVAKLKALKSIHVYHQSLHTFVVDYARDAVLVKGVLIHIDPRTLEHVYDLLYRTARRFICIAEYYNPTPVTVAYRGHKNRLFKRDFAGEMLDRYPDLSLVKYGFVYHRDVLHPQDDLTWFLLRKGK
jgi:pseudaminic acid biosynthesis-associated methylase